jgi:RNA polymerase sigma-70 factor, ECF subfamily
MTPEEEARLVGEAKQGDNEAFDKLAQHYRRVIFSYCFAMLKNREAAEDATQDVFLRAFSKLHQQSSVDAFQWWLRRIARNVCFNELRRKGEIPLSEDDDSNRLRDAAPSPFDRIHLSEQQHLVRKLLANLTPLQRESVYLSHVEGLSEKEIASITGAKTGAIRKRVFDGIAALRKALLGARGIL